MGVPYPDDDWKPDLSAHEKVGSMAEEGLNDGRVEGIKERSRGEFPFPSALLSPLGIWTYSVPVNGPYLPKFSTKRKPVNHYGSAWTKIIGPDQLTYPDITGESEGKNGGEDHDRLGPELIAMLILPISERLHQEDAATC